MKLNKFFFLLISVFVISPHLILADTLLVPKFKDNTIAEVAPDNTYGSATTISIDDNPGGNQRFQMQILINQTELLDGNFEGAVVSLKNDYFGEARNIEVYWINASVTLYGPEADLSWNKQNCPDGNPGVAVSNRCNSTAISIVYVDSGKRWNFNITSGVKRSLALGHNNISLLFIGDDEDTAGPGLDFHSGEAVVEANRPIVNFTYSAVIPDTTPPGINITSPINDTTYTDNFVLLNWTINESSGFCVYSLDNGANVTCSPLVITDLEAINLTGITDKSQGTGCDVSGYVAFRFMNYTEDISYGERKGKTIDSPTECGFSDGSSGETNPVKLNILAIAELNIVEGDYITITYDGGQKLNISLPVMFGTGNPFVNLRISDNGTTTNLTSNRVTSIPLTGLSDGLHNVTIYANDSSGNMGQSDYVYWTVSTDTCDCPGLNQNWEIDHSDACVITDDCDLGTGILTFIGTGTTTCNAIINTPRVGDTGAGGLLYPDSNCLIDTS